jgi:hypothetical protein
MAGLGRQHRQNVDQGLLALKYLQLVGPKPQRVLLRWAGFRLRFNCNVRIEIRLVRLHKLDWEFALESETDMEIDVKKQEVRIHCTTFTISRSYHLSVFEMRRVLFSYQYLHEIREST